MTATAALPPSTTSFPIPAGVHAERIVSVHHYTDRLFSFRVTRPQSFRFRSGEFVMIGLPNAEKPVFRAYSIASPAWDEELEFFSIKVENGPLTQHLQKIRVLDALLPGRRLWMLSTGAGIASFASIMRDPATYEMFEQVILTHTCREVAELAYGFDLVCELDSNPLTSEFVRGRFTHYATTTREPYLRTGRITELIWNESLFRELGTGSFDPQHDRIMICGSIDMNQDLKAIAEAYGLREGSNNAPAEFVLERAFVG